MGKIPPLKLQIPSEGIHLPSAENLWPRQRSNEECSSSAEVFNCGIDLLEFPSYPL